MMYSYGCYLSLSLIAIRKSDRISLWFSKCITYGCTIGVAESISVVEPHSRANSEPNSESFIGANCIKSTV